MKKIFAIAILLCTVFIMTGCGQSGKLTCTMDSSEEGVEVKSTMVFSFNGNDVSKVDTTVNANLPSEFLKYKDQFISALKGQYVSFENDYGTKLNVKETDNGVVFSFTMKKDAIKGTYKATTRDEVKETIEKEGYICK